MPNHCYYLAISFTNHLYLYSYIYSLAMHLRYSCAPLVYLYIYLDVRYVILYFDPRVFVLVMWSTESQIALNRILWFIDQYPYHPRNLIVYRFEFFWGAVKTQKLMGAPFLSEFVAVVSQCALCRGYKPWQQYLLENTLSTRLPRR